MEINEQLKAARAALRHVVDTDGSNLPGPVRRFAAKTLAFTEEALAESFCRQQPTEARALNVWRRRRPAMPTR